MKKVSYQSILFVPAHRLDLVGKAVAGSATAICLDLEDGVAPESKALARKAVKGGFKRVRDATKTSLVRINSEFEILSDDLASIARECDAVVLPKTGSLHQVNLLADALDRLFGVDGPAIICLVESGFDLDHLRIDAGIPSKRLVALCLGTEDLSADLETGANSELINHAFLELALLCRRWEIMLLGFPGSIAEFRDLNQFSETAIKGASAGAMGAFCIHPKQVQVLNNVFQPDAQSQQQAARIVQAFDAAAAKGEGVCSLDGRMIDRPVYLRALRLLARAQASC